MRFRFRRKALSADGKTYKCPGCKQTLDVDVVRANLRVCPECDYHFSLPAHERIASLIDEGTFEPLTCEPVQVDPLAFKDRVAYADRLAREREATGLEEVLVAGTGRLRGCPVVIAATDIDFLRGSMGVAGGEAVAAAAELAAESGRPLVVVSNSVGGARIHEGTFALMQMAKTSAAVARLSEAGGLFVSVIANPTMGGVMASFPALGDVTLAEPGAVSGFAGSSIIEEAIKKDLPPGFQTAEYLMERGFIDAIVPRAELAQEIARIIEYCWHTADQ